MLFPDGSDPAVPPDEVIYAVIVENRGPEVHKPLRKVDPPQEVSELKSGLGKGAFARRQRKLPRRDVQGSKRRGKVVGVEAPGQLGVGFVFPRYREVGPIGTPVCSDQFRHLHSCGGSFWGDSWLRRKRALARE